MENLSPTPRLSSSSYSNTAPIIWSFLYGSRRSQAELLLDTAPARSAELLEKSDVTAAFVPVIAYQKINDVKIVPNVCVGARDKVKSVVIVTKEKDLSEIKSLALDVSSKTSAALTRIIFREFLAREPKFADARPNLEEMLQGCDGALLIGDPALIVDRETFRVFDLAEEWRRFTGCGFIFAMWLARLENAAIVKTLDLQGAVEEGCAHLDEIGRLYVKELNLSADEMRDYLTRNIVFQPDESMLRGLDLYFQLAAKHNFINCVKPLEFLF